MSKFFKSSLSLLVTAAFAMTGFSSANAQTPINLDTPYESSTPVDYLITVPGAGYLKVECSPGFPMMYSLMLDEVDVDQTGNLEYGDDSQVATYKVRAGQYEFATYFNYDQPITLTFRFVEAGDMPSEPADTEGYMPLEMNYVYQGTYEGLQAENGGSLLLYYTAPENGTLIVRQYGNADVWGDNHMFTQKPVFDNDEWGWTGSANTMIMAPTTDGYKMITDIPDDAATAGYGCEMKYGMMTGETLFSVCKLNAGDATAYIQFLWEGESGDVTEIQLDTPYTLASENKEIYAYTATADGYLTVETTSFDTSIAAIPAAQHFLYYNAAHSNEVSALSSSEGKEGYAVKFFVEEGTTYYLYNPATASVMFTFSFEAGELEAKLAYIYPIQPGDAFDPNSFDSTFNIGFEPTTVTIGSVSVKYPTASGITTLPVAEGVYGCYQNIGNAYSFNYPILIRPDGTRNYDDIANSIWPLIDGEYITYVLENVNANGVPVTGSDIALSDNLKIDNGNIEITFKMQPAPKMESATWPEKFLSFWKEGDETAKAILTFEEEINPDFAPEVSIMEGTKVDGQTPGEEDQEWTVPADKISISGNTLTIDFSGVERKSTKSTVTVRVTGVVSQSGQQFKFGESLSIFKTLSFTEVEVPEEPADITYTVSPESQTQIDVTPGDTYEFTVTFSEGVKIGAAKYKQGAAHIDFEATPVDGDGEISKAWKFEFPATNINYNYYGAKPNEEFPPMLSAIITPVNDEGEEIALNGEEDNNLVEVFYPFEVKEYGAPYEVQVEETVEGKLETFNVSAPGFKTITGYTNTASVGANLAAVKITGDSGFEANVVSCVDGVVTFTPYINVSGTYTINLPYHAFDISSEAVEGEEGDPVFDSQAKVVTFTVTVNNPVADADKEELVITDDHTWFPENQVKYYYTPDTNRKLTYKIYDTGIDGYNSTGFIGGLYKASDSSAAITPVDGDGAPDDWGLGMWISSTGSWNLEQGVEYYFVWNKNDGIDEYALDLVWEASADEPIYDDDLDDVNMEHGNPELTADEPESTTPVNRTQVTDVNFHWGDEYDAALNGDDKVVTIKKYEGNKNEKQLTPSIEEGALVVPVASYFATLEKVAENNGVYVINIPAETVVISKKAQGVALLADEATIYNAEKNVYMNLDVMTGIYSILDADENGLYRVYNLSGVNVLNTEDALEINNLVPGIYIVNGKKVAVK